MDMDTVRNEVLAGATERIARAALRELLTSVDTLWREAAAGDLADTEAVHQLRVSTRRSGAALDVFAHFLPARASRRLERKLAKLRRRAGRARDYDVLAGRYARLPGIVPPGLIELLDMRRAQARSAIRALHEHWQQEGILERAAGELVRAVRPRRTEARRAASRGGSIPFHRFAPRRLRKIAQRFYSAGDTDPRRLEDMHPLRIRAKQLRYGLDLLRAGLAAERFDKVYALVKKLTQRLGEVNDDLAAAGIAAELLAKQDAIGNSTELREWLEQRVAAERGAAADRFEAFRHWWTPRRQRRLRRRLKKLARHDAPVQSNGGDAS
ncbi:MAG: CHAD domain-containing protein [Pirellulaceae bacterium]